MQYVYNIETMECLLKESLNIAKGIPVKFNSNISVYSIESNLCLFKYNMLVKVNLLIDFKAMQDNLNMMHLMGLKDTVFRLNIKHLLGILTIHLKNLHKVNKCL